MRESLKTGIKKMLKVFPLEPTPRYAISYPIGDTGALQTTVYYQGVDGFFFSKVVERVPGEIPHIIDDIPEIVMPYGTDKL